MRIVMITNAMAPDKLGGLERYVGELSAELVAQGHAVTAIVKATHPRQAARTVNSAGVETLRYVAPSKSDPLFAAKYPLAVRRGVLDALEAVAPGRRPSLSDIVIHGHFPVPLIPVARRGIPFVYTFHAPLHQELLGERQGSYVLPRPLQRVAVAGVSASERYVLRAASEVTTLSAFMHSEERQLLGRRHIPHTLIPGGLDTSRFSSLDGARPPRDVGSGPVVVTARRLVHRTGVENLVGAMPAVVRRHSDVRLVVLGDGPRREAIEDFIRAERLEGNVLLLGRVSDEELVDWYRSATLAVTPTLELEGFGLSTAEAMACGTPALVTPVGANPEVVQGLGPEFVAGGNDAASIAKALLNLLGNAQVLDTARSAARGLVEPRFNWSSVSDQFLSLYDRQLHRQTR